MAVDDNGNLYVADDAGIDVFDATAAKLGTITVDEKPSNCTFGGADRKTLYITAKTGLYSIVLNVPGLP
jgi:gluconolactonase